MDTLELTAPNLDEARALAASQLGVDPALITLTVLEEKKGLFGRPGSIKVKAEAKAAPAEKPAKEAKPKGRTAKAAPAAPADEPAPAAAEEAEAAPAEPETEAEPEPAKPAKGRGRAKKDAPAAAEGGPAAEEAAAPAESSEEPAVERSASDEDGDFMVNCFNQMFDEGDLRVKAKVVSLTGKYINIELDGRDVSWLVGKRGEVLNALQYLGNVIASRQLNNGARVVLDGNKFRERRLEILTKQATDIAEQVKANGMEAVLDPLPAFERRIVHQALADYPGVVTYSEGEEPARKVVIAPAE